MPHGFLISVTPLPIFCHDASAEKSRLMTFSKVSLTTPLQELKRRRDRVENVGVGAEKRRCSFDTETDFALESEITT